MKVFVEDGMSQLYSLKRFIGMFLDYENQKRILESDIEVAQERCKPGATHLFVYSHPNLVSVTEL